MKGYVSVSEAAKIKNVTRQAIYLAIRLKRLRAYRHEDKWRVFLVDLNEYDERRYSRIYHSTEPIFDDHKISVEKASQMIKVPKQKIYYAIRTGLLKATRKNSSWVVLVSDLFHYQSELPNEKDLTVSRAY